MTEGIIVALIAGVVSSLGSILSLYATRKVKKDKLQEDQDKANSDIKKELQNSISEIKDTLGEHRQEYIKKIEAVEKSFSRMESTYEKESTVIKMQIADLEKAQNKHNNLIERTYCLEKAVAVQDEMIKVANHRIEDLEKQANAQA